jgi:hypothetical protein
LDRTSRRQMLAAVPATHQQKLKRETLAGALIE